jgi:hypothetical protein
MDWNIDMDDIVLTNTDFWSLLMDKIDEIKRLETEYSNTLTIEKINILDNIDLKSEPIYDIIEKPNGKTEKKINKNFIKKISKIKTNLNNHLKNVNIEIVGLDKNYSEVVEN